MNYTLYNDDFKNVVRDIPDESVDLILIDIPFNISRENNFKTMKDRTGRNGIDFGEWDKGFDVTSLSILPSKLTPNGSLLIFHSFEQFSELQDIFYPDLVFKDKLIWEKTNPMPRNRDRRYVNNIEMFSWYVKKNAKWAFNRQDSKYDSCVFRYPSESGGGFKRYHPCQKNLALIENLIKRHSNEGEIVMDCFMGGGTTGVACVHTNRNFIGVEIDEGYYNIAKERIENAKWANH